MGSFRGHIVPGSLFLLVGLWNAYNSVLNFVGRRGSSGRSSAFRGKLWHPVPIRGLRHLELYAITLGALADLCIEFFYSPHFRYLADGGLNSAHLNNFEHSAMLLMFVLFGLVTLVHETTRRLVPLPEGAVNVIGAMAFTSEYLLFYFHSTTHRGMEGRYHELLVYSIGLCILLSALGAAFPNSFAVDLGSGLSLILQGLWFYVTAFALYGSWMPDGCKSSEHGVKCQASVYEARAQSLANSQFCFVLVALSAALLVFYAVAASIKGSPELLLDHAEELKPQ